MTFAEDYRSTIMWALTGLVTQLNRTGVDPSRMALLVSEPEWDELAKHLRTFRHYCRLDDLTETPRTKITYCGFEVRKR